MNAVTKLKKLPRLMSDEEAEQFLDTADLSEYDLSSMKRVRFEFKNKDARVNMRLPASLLAEVKAAAAKAGMPYQRFIRQALEGALGR
jgi:predicted DNA binding CopG/RHH family protein